MFTVLSPVVVQGVAYLAQLPQYILMNSCTWGVHQLGAPKDEIQVGRNIYGRYCQDKWT